MDIFRKFIVWPVLVVLALNIEGIAEMTGSNEILKNLWPIVSGFSASIFEFATQKTVLYVALFLAGLVTYEWGVFLVRKISSRSPQVRLKLLKNQCHSAQWALNDNSIIQKFGNSSLTLMWANDLLDDFELPLIPETSIKDPDILKRYVRYLELVRKGEWAHARTHYSKCLLEHSHLVSRIASDAPKLFVKSEDPVCL